MIIIIIFKEKLNVYKVFNIYARLLLLCFVVKVWIWRWMEWKIHPVRPNHNSNNLSGQIKLIHWQWKWHDAYYWHPCCYQRVIGGFANFILPMSVWLWEVDIDVLFNANSGTAEYNCKIVLISSLLWRNYDYQNSINVIENIAFSSGLKKEKKTF